MCEYDDDQLGALEEEEEEESAVTEVKGENFIYDAFDCSSS